MKILTAHKGRAIVTIIEFNPIAVKEYLTKQFKTAKTETATISLVSKILGITDIGEIYTKTYRVLSGSETTLYFQAHEIEEDII